MKSSAAVLLALVAASGCRTVPMGTTASIGPAETAQAAGTGSSSTVGASTPKGAVEMMLAAAQIQDLQAMSAVWGDEKGMTRDRITRDELEKRTLVMTCLLKHDGQTVHEPQMMPGGRFQISADLTQKANAASAMFTVAKSSAGRWLVTQIDMVQLQNKGFCPRSGG